MTYMLIFCILVNGYEFDDVCKITSLPPHLPINSMHPNSPKPLELALWGVLIENIIFELTGGQYSP
jgi:hypothetical protein